MSNKPKLRFPQFSDDWEQRKLDEVVGVYDGTHQTPNYTDHGVRFVSVENISTLETTKYISEDDFAKNYKVVPQKGDILMTRIGDIGTANVVKTNEPLAYYVSLALLKNKGLDSLFLKASIESAPFQNELWLRTLHTAYPKKINKDEIGKCFINLPSIAEQQKIGSVFEKLDNTIALHQRKLDSMKEYKAGMLQKMFPKEGETVPEIRFPQFEGDWEQHKLGELTFACKEKNRDGNRPVYSVTNAEGFIPQSEQFSDREVASNNKANYSIVRKNQFAYNPSRINVGSIAYLKDDIEVIISPLYVVFECTKQLNEVFLDEFVRTNQFHNQRETLTAGSVRDNLSYDGFSEIIIPVPTIEEQKRISDFLTKLDNTIALHQQKLDAFKEYKKGLLQQMFV